MTMAVRILATAGRDRPADALLREELGRVRGVPRETGAIAAALVFRYYRWRGWLDRSQSWVRQIDQARELAERFDRDPESFGADEWVKCIPGWAASEARMSDSHWLRSLQGEPRLWLRARRGVAETLALELGDTERPCDLAPEALWYRGKADIFRSEAFHEGRLEIQDLASQLVTLAADPRPGEAWWDACAGEGGKTLHLADLMANRGIVWATDRADWRLQRLRRRAARAGLFNIRWGSWDGLGAPPGNRKFDGVLMDAPCSGIGTWQRNPHARWTLTETDVRELAECQLSLLRAAKAGVARGGRLIYAVCTLTVEETTGVTDRFEAEGAEWEPWPFPDPFRRGPSDPSPAHHLWILPQDWGGNGMFVAAWRLKP